MTRERMAQLLNAAVYSQNYGEMRLTECLDELNRIQAEIREQAKRSPDIAALMDCLGIEP